MPSDRYIQMRDAIEAARQRLSLIRQGLISVEVDDVAPRRRVHVVRVQRQFEHLDSQSGSRTPSFHIPATRSYRLTNSAGASSFHFSHRSVAKVTFETCQDSVRVRPGAARAHGRYVEREAAVADLGADLDAEALPASNGLNRDVAEHPVSKQEHRHEHDYTHDQRIDPWLGAGLVGYEPPSEPGAEGLFAGTVVGRPVEDSLTDARVRLLSRGDLVRHGGGTHGILRSSADVSVEGGAGDLGLRCPSEGDRDEGSRLSAPTLRGRGDAIGHDKYVGRQGAVAIQPEGTRALITNIDPDDDERAKFWSLVEEHEAVNRGDTMSLRVADNSVFWSQIAARDDCPPELKAALAKASPTETIRFAVDSSREMRAFLASHPGWVPPHNTKKGKVLRHGDLQPFAKFHDGRGGRTQFRIVGELPEELDSAGRFAILQEFSQQFAKRNLPFVAVMHAPDHKNDERNWHFHLLYYDRPCRRITNDDIADLNAKGYRANHLEVGMWDFSAVTPKKGRTNGKAVPLKQNKITEVAQDGWIEMLRSEFARINNRHLSASRAKRRLDPRRYEEMGIVADPQEHLGTAQAAAETRGEVTEIGRGNEHRQYAAIMAEGEARFAAAMTNVEVLNQRQHAGDESWVRKREALIEAAQLKHMAFGLDQDIERACSRARSVQRKNRQLLDAYQADPKAGTAKERAEAANLVEAATRYLAQLELELGADASLPKQARALANLNLKDRTTSHAHSAAPQRSVRTDAARDTPIIPAPPASPATAGYAPVKERVDPQPLDAELARQQVANEAAKLAAIAAAMRGQGL